MSTRPAERKDSIAAYVREQIISGVWAPGEQIPKRTELEERFGAGPVTVQRALDSLCQDGFVHATARRGTFVAERPPHLARFALVFQERPEFTGPFYEGLIAEAKRRTLHGENSFEVYFSVDGHIDSPDYVRLTEDVRQHRLAGIIFSTSPYKVRNTPLLREDGIPNVSISRGFGVAGMRAICSFDRVSFFERALTHFVRAGRERVAFVMPPSFSSEVEVQALVTKHGLVSHPYWYHELSHDLPDAARALTHLIFNPHQTERPDALLVADDKMVEPAFQGLTASGLELGKDLDMVGHCNFPDPVAGSLPVTRLGFDLREVFDACLSSLAAQRQGRTSRDQAVIGAKFDEEVE